jgi:hypothetical protein
LLGYGIFAIMNTISLINEIKGGPGSSFLGCTEEEELLSKADTADNWQEPVPPSKITSRRLNRTMPLRNSARAIFGIRNA